MDTERGSWKELFLDAFARNKEFLITKIKSYVWTSKEELERYHKRYSNSNLYYTDYLQLRKPHVSD